jgi:hypothetical protein
MTPRQFVAALKKLGLTPGSKRAAETLGVTVRQNLRYAFGETAVQATVVKLLECLIEVARREKNRFQLHFGCMEIFGPVGEPSKLLGNF